MNLKRVLMAGALTLGVTLAGQTAASAASSYSVVDYLAAQGEDASFNHRGELAASHGITGYRGTADQNLQLLAKLKGGVNYSKPAEPKQEAKTQTATQTNSQSLTVVATAYTAYCSGCSGVTATGVNLKANPGQKVIAVDPNVIPLGSRVYVEGYGEAIAADTGGAIKGNRIDVFIPSQSEAVNYGRKTVKINILN
ncbi:putative cell wall binding protein [Bacillus phage BSP38]|uniref:Putative cell wall binding protein n=1 Tax=Bacillus phage BSP38 TaxID=2283013 RepID=A0A345MJU2_BPBSP|nr:L-alanyl-D-glutamate peptidase [Bacillus phage BSP38]AXH71124.1 putative cell wall binding protein [Bacillus phage BSP38]